MKNKRFLALYILLITFFSGSLHAAYFRNIGVKDGLSQLSVISLHQDVLGRIWFGTLQGLSIYDGKEMITLRGGDERFDTFIKNNSILNIVENAAHDIFLRADRALIGYRFDEDKFWCIREKGVDAVASIEGKIYVAVGDSILIWDEESDGLRFFMKTEIPQGIVKNMVRDRSGNWWFSTSKGLYKRAGEQWMCMLPEPSVEAVYESNDSDIWVATRGHGLYRIDTGGNVSSFVHNPGRIGTICSNDVRTVTEDRQGNLWVGTRGGLNKYVSAGNYFEAYVAGYLPGSLKHSSVFSLLPDCEGNLWVGTYYGGAGVFTPGDEQFWYYPADSGREDCLSFPFVSDVTEDKRGNLWICTDGGGLNFMDRRTGLFNSFDMLRWGGKSNNLKSICYDSDADKLYIGSYLAGLISYDIRTGKFESCLEHLEKNNPHHTVSRVCMYQGKVVFLSDYGIFLFDPQLNRVSPLLEVKGAVSFLIDSKNRLWALHNGNVVCADMCNTQLQRHYNLRESGIGNHVLLCICEAGNGEIYVGTEGGGVLGYDSHTDCFSLYNARNNGLLDDYCYNMTAFGEEEVLFLSNRGLSFFNSVSKKVECVVTGDKLPVSAFCFDNGLYVSVNKDIYVGNADGLIVLSGDKVRTLEKRRSLYFSGLFVNNTRVTPGDETGILNRIIAHTNQIVLKHDQNNLSFTFADNDFGYSLFPSFYEYKLEDFDKKWIEANGQQLTYTNLNPGTYILKIREKDIYGNASGREIQLPIVIRQPLWNTPWAWICYLLSIATILYVIISGRLRQLRLKTSLEDEKREKEHIEEINRFKLDFFTNVSHELRTPLTLIITQAEILLGSTDITKSLYEKIFKLYKHASGMRNMISELLDFHKLEQDRMRLQVQQQDISSFLNEIYLSFKEQAVSQNIQYTFAGGDSVCCWFDPLQLRKVFSNLLSNALKFTQKGGMVELSFSEDESGIIIRVMDNGTGIDSADLQRVFERFYQSSGKNHAFSSGIGLALCKDIVSLHHGEITVESKLGYGSIFIVRLKKGVDHFIDDQRVDILCEQENNIPIDSGSLPDSDFMELLQESNPDAVTEEDPEESGRRILIVEDNDDLLSLLVDIFSPLYSVSTATDGEIGLQKTLEEQPDIVLSDIMMPRMDGNEMCRRIKNNLRTCHIPVVLLTARIAPEQHIEGLLAGADDYVTKSFNVKILLAKINTIVRNRELLQGAFQRKPESCLELLGGNEQDQKLLKKVEEIVEMHMEDPDFDVDQLASLVGMGRSSFFKKLKVLTGMTPASFILVCRLQKAAALLLERPDFQMNDIAASLGFGSGRYFSRCFKNHFNISPQQYREQNRN